MLDEKDGGNARKGISLSKVLRETGEKTLASRGREGM